MPKAPDCLALLAALALTFSAGAAGAQSPPSSDSASREAIDEARTHYERGIQLYNEGTLDVALIEFQRSYELVHSYKLLYNIGQVHAQLGNPSAALTTFEKYLADGGTDIQAKRRAEVEKEVASLRSRTARLEITTNVEGVDIAIDDVPIGKTPLSEPIVVNSGRRTITATKAGRVTGKKVLGLAGMDDMKIEIDLPEAPAAGTMAQPVHERTIIQTAPEKAPNYAWIGWVATGALTTAAVVMGVLSLGKQDDLQKATNTVTNEDDLKSAQSTARTYALTTDVLIGAAILTGAISFYFTVKGTSSAPKTAQQTTALRIGVAPRGLSLSKSF